MLKKLYIAFLVVALVTLIGMLAAQPSDAAEFHLIELKETSLGFQHYLPGSHSVLINEHGPADRELDKGYALQTNFDVMTWFYWDNTIHAQTDRGLDGSRGQFRTVGWQYQFGIRLSDFLRVEYEHHSQHILDYDREQRFPTEDSIGFKLIIYRAKDARESVF